MEKNIKVAILGIGNCASSFVQGIEHYSNSDNEDGLISDVIGGFKVSDIEVVAAYDINTTKVGKDLSEAIFAEPNNTIKFSKLLTSFNNYIISQLNQLLTYQLAKPQGCLAYYDWAFPGVYEHCCHGP